MKDKWTVISIAKAIQTIPYFREKIATDNKAICNATITELMIN